MMGRNIVVINEYKAAVDLFEKQRAMHFNRCVSYHIVPTLRDDPECETFICIFR